MFYLVASLTYSERLRVLRLDAINDSQRLLGDISDQLSEIGDETSLAEDADLLADSGNRIMDDTVLTKLYTLKSQLNDLCHKVTLQNQFIRESN